MIAVDGAPASLMPERTPHGEVDVPVTRAAAERMATARLAASPEYLPIWARISEVGWMLPAPAQGPNTDALQTWTDRFSTLGVGAATGY